MTYNLFLDDERNPEDVTWKALPKTSWVVVRSFKEFHKTLKEKGPPELVSFDHDIGEFRTGATCAQALIEFDLNVWKGAWNGKFEVHSQNPVGARNIQFDLQSYLRLRGVSLD